jgi:hypothetical protein
MDIVVLIAVAHLAVDLVHLVVVARVRRRLVK